MAANIVQAQEFHDASFGTFTAYSGTLTTNVTSGNVLIVLMSTNVGTSTTVTYTVAGGGSVTAIKPAGGEGTSPGGGTAGVWYSTLGTGGQCIVTGHSTAATGVDLIVLEVSGLDTGSLFGAAANGNGTSTSPLATTGAQPATADWFVVAGAMWDTSNSTPTAAQSLTLTPNTTHQYDATLDVPEAGGTKTVTATSAAQSGGFTIASQGWACCVGTFMVLAAATSRPPAAPMVRSDAFAQNVWGD